MCRAVKEVDLEGGWVREGAAKSKYGRLCAGRVTFCAGRVTGGEGWAPFRVSWDRSHVGRARVDALRGLRRPKVPHRAKSVRRRAKVAQRAAVAQR